MKYSHDVELDGHIVDSGIMEHVLDTILDMGGDFEILTFDIGKLKEDTSYAKIKVITDKPEKLERITSQLHRRGARLVDIDDVVLQPAIADKVVPYGFYSTTNYPTEIRVDGEWHEVLNIEMDCLIVVDQKNKSVQCLPISHLKAGNLVVIGEQGVQVRPPERARESGIFEFMGGEVSSERPTHTIIKKIAEEMFEVCARGGKVALVGGPAIIHTGAAEALAGMIRDGHIHVLFAGNALATHDIEYSLFGTSLGMDLKTGLLISAGHKHHLYAISEIIRIGSIKEAVERGILTSGIMYECVKHNVPYVLAGSIRDDGPLPDVITDCVAAQDAMRKYVPGIDMVLMVATMLHSVAVGNCLPASVRTICVDINPSTVTKLMDRGTKQATGVVSDAGTFIPMLAEELATLSSNK
jgi:lysine-ketoglutarate reductase/saccharopine dehydrogenase-like protein (TIGR00300 family)